MLMSAMREYGPGLPGRDYLLTPMLMSAMREYAPGLPGRNC